MSEREREEWEKQSKEVCDRAFAEFAGTAMTQTVIRLIEANDHPSDLHALDIRVRGNT